MYVLIQQEYILIQQTRRMDLSHDPNYSFWIVSCQCRFADQMSSEGSEVNLHCK